MLLAGGRSGGFDAVPFARPRSALGDRLAEEALPALLGGGRAELGYPITNRDRSVGARLAGAVAHAIGDDAPPGRARVALTGDAGQSLGAFLTDGVELRLEGTANDGVGKGMAGGRIVVAAAPGVEDDPVLIGNAALYGATGGELFVAGSAGERFAVRNSGATAVVEGVGANGCEYMTGGLVVVLGEVGPNFAAGMTGGLAYVLDPDGTIDRFVNPDLVHLLEITAEDRHELADLLRRHMRHTASGTAHWLLSTWPRVAGGFRALVPKAAPVVTVVEPGLPATVAAAAGR
jgi:glutamate synthase domain-containing protein 3